MALLLGLFIHLDWHLARHSQDGRSLGWSAHWLLAIPIFALAAGYLARRWPANPWRPAALSVALGILLGQVIEPLGEIIHYHATLAEELEPARLTAFATFTVTGLVTMGLTLAALARRARKPPSVPTQ
jgi:peptidoglycan/LPS O-acetylase OafA/YrhL